MSYFREIPFKSLPKYTLSIENSCFLELQKDVILQWKSFFDSVKSDSTPVTSLTSKIDPRPPPALMAKICNKMDNKFLIFHGMTTIHGVGSGSVFRDGSPRKVRQELRWS